MNKKIYPVLAASLMFIASTNLALAAQLPSPSKTPTVSLDQIAAVVNSDIITQTQLSQAVTVAKNEYRNAKAPLPSNSLLERQVLNQLINQKIQLQLAQKAKITATSSETDKAISNIAKQNKLTLAQLKQKVAATGLSFSAYRTQIRDQMIMSKLRMQIVSGDVKVSSAEINKLYQQYQTSGQGATKYHVADILIPLSATPSPAEIEKAKAIANNIKEQLQHGTALKKIIIPKTNVAQTPATNDLGWRTLADLPDMFTQPLQKMKADGVAGPLRAANGFHVIKLEGTKKSNLTPTKVQIKQMVLNQKYQQKFQQWLQKQKAGAYIKINI